MEGGAGTGFGAFGAGAEGVFAEELFEFFDAGFGDFAFWRTGVGFDDIVVVDDGGAGLFDFVVEAGDFEDTFTGTALEVFDIFFSLGDLFAFGITVGKVFEGLASFGGGSAIVGTLAGFFLADIANLVEGIGGDGVAGIFIGGGLVGFDGLGEFALFFEGLADVELGESGVFTKGGIFDDAFEHGLGASHGRGGGEAEDLLFLAFEEEFGDGEHLFDHGVEVTPLGILGEVEAIGFVGFIELVAFLEEDADFALGFGGDEGSAVAFDEGFVGFEGVGIIAVGFEFFGAAHLFGGRAGDWGVIAFDGPAFGGAIDEGGHGLGERGEASEEREREDEGKFWHKGGG